jgi:hypothetical protein
MNGPHLPATHAWTTYVQQFHAEHPGITERILTRLPRSAWWRAT